MLRAALFQAYSLETEEMPSHASRTVPVILLHRALSTGRPSGHTGNLRGLPKPILLTANHWQVALDQSLSAPISKHSVHCIAKSRATKYLSQGQLWWRPTGHKPHLAGVGQVVVAGHIAPLALVMPHHDHTVLPRQEVAVRLPRVPVFIKQRGTI